MGPASQGLGVHPDGDGAVVHRLHRHVRAERPVLHLEAPCPAQVQKGLIQGNGHRRGRGLGEPGPAALDIGVQGELGTKE